MRLPQPFPDDNRPQHDWGECDNELPSFVTPPNGGMWAWLLLFFGTVRRIRMSRRAMGGTGHELSQSL